MPAPNDAHQPVNCCRCRDSPHVTCRGLNDLVRTSAQDDCFASLPRLQELRIVPPRDDVGLSKVDMTGLPARLPTLEVCCLRLTTMLPPSTCSRIAVISLPLQQHVVPAAFRVKTSGTAFVWCQVSVLGARGYLTVRLAPGPPAGTLRLAACRMDIEVTRSTCSYCTRRSVTCCRHHRAPFQHHIQHPCPQAGLRLSFSRTLALI